ncbi:glutathione-dependent peroxiredoxin [Cupriavidus metallidurans]|jgi:glutaredoxin-like protein|uniref:Peroxiredoxin/glutaredoxin, Thioredoxin reductase n=1 Tax=Cupriavidus metallidurans (strain ATCC 43123 / DSM 2839 / NBRC 102507 / CH34) TaxID=266264 RepID=Q1LDM5_CUPMC|nr:glutathione peroxidase [Cupriavidus metallidurans]ABF11751.1 peroxiredoxin/glutaredoxin, Thioredoxin reductase [Cupriavidus metallidurans CH34]KWW35146.1 Hybrid peroxiredoxin hyPrx5 [Cupriavidus metallidurans]MDE4922327.1 glutathione peroxidase [Cupriavidus metallidurans]QGS31568.1 redoxin family protein [Cupriavidus metallidurans]UBM08222.1 glutathione peroxidase [Cupriavidus metallidurans]
MLQSREGQRVPNVTFRVRANNEWKDVTTAELFDGKTVVLFSLPGAFTPTCSSTHLPRYNELAPVFAKQGVDAILCVSVNDTFVMNEWAKDQESENIVMIPDGNGEFTDGMGMLVDKADLGFGKRSWRYSMLVKDGVVDKMFIEPEEPGDPFKVSDADTMLNYIAPTAKQPDQVVVFSKIGCSHCAKAKQLLSDNGFEYIDVPLENKIRGKVLGAVSGEMTAPQVFINGKLVGGAEALEQYLAR